MTESSVQLLYGDCLDLMGSIPDGSVDMVLADLPYGTTACKWDTVIPLEPLWKHYKRVIKRNGAIVLTASQPFTSALVMSNPQMFRYTLVWDKVASTQHMNAKKQPLRGHDDICVFYQSQPTYNPQMTLGKAWHRGGKLEIVSEVYGVTRKHMSRYNGPDLTKWKYPRSIIQASSADRTNLLHPSQKPVALMEYLIRTYTNEGECVLDNTMGSGTTGVACINTGRHFIGIEKDAGYFQIAEKRIQEAQSKARQLVMEGVA